MPKPKKLFGLNDDMKHIKLQQVGFFSQFVPSIIEPTGTELNLSALWPFFTSLYLSLLLPCWETQMQLNIHRGLTTVMHLMIPSQPLNLRLPNRRGFSATGFIIQKADALTYTCMET